MPKQSKPKIFRKQKLSDISKNKSSPKISILGIGTVGAEVAQWCAMKELGELILWNQMPDKVPHPAAGNALDIMEGGPAGGYWPPSIKGSANLRDTAYSDVIVITAGMPRKPGMRSRDELVHTNADIIRSLIKETFPYSRRAVYIIATNPLDAMTYVAIRSCKAPRERILGMAGALDTSRYIAFIAEATNTTPKQIKNAYVIGEHGENMIPLSRLAKVKGIPLATKLPRSKVDEIEDRTKNAGSEIIRMLESSAAMATGAACASMVEAIVKNTNTTIPCSVYLEGEYGLKDVCIGVPVVLGKGGMKKIVDLKLNKTEKNQLNLAAKKIRSTIDIAMAGAK